MKREKFEVAYNRVKEHLEEMKRNMEPIDARFAFVAGFVSAHKRDYNPNWTARQLSMLFEMVWMRGEEGERSGKIEEKGTRP